MNYQEEKKYIGHKDQLMKVKKIRMEDGKASGVEMVDVQNRSGMHFDVNISRGMDIPYLDFCGENIGFISPCVWLHRNILMTRDLDSSKALPRDS